MFEVSGGIHRLISKELPKSTVELVRSGFRHHAHDTPGGASILRKIVMPLGLEFLNGVYDGRIVIHTEHRVQVVLAVEHEIVAAISRAVDRWKCEASEGVTSPPTSSARALV